MRGRGRFRTQLADDRTRIRIRPFGKFDVWRANLHQFALSAEQASDAARARRGHLDHGLVGFDRHQGLVGDHMVALGDVPGDDFRLFQAFAQIRQQKLMHGPSMHFS